MADDAILPVVRDTLETIGNAGGKGAGGIRIEQRGTVVSVGNSIAKIRGLQGLAFQELVRFENGGMGLTMTLDGDRASVALFDRGDDIESGSVVVRTGRVADIGAGHGLLGRIIDPLGRPLDGGDEPATETRLPIERDAPDIMDRAPVEVPLQTGIQMVDALIPVGRGQRELILGDRQTGKTAIALDTIINQRNFDVVCIYCAIGKRSDAVAKVIRHFRDHGAMEYTVVMVATGEDSPGLNYIAPYAAMSIGEYFMEQGKNALVVFDDLTRHAWSYRELSLLMRRPPAREAYPGDIFYIHASLLERSTHLRDDLGGGSLTALPIIETQEQNLSAYIPTNLISITDGQIYLSPDLFQEGILPAIDVGTSVSRVGGKTQLPAYRRVAGDLRLSYSQFRELESFARFGTKLDEETKHTLEHGRRVRETLKQRQFAPIPVFGQVAVLLAVSEGKFDGLPLDLVDDAKHHVRSAARKHNADIGEKIANGGELGDDDADALRATIDEALTSLRNGEGTGDGDGND